MSVASANPFAILGAVEDSTPPGSPGPATQKKDASASQTTRAPPKKGPASRGGRYYTRGGKTQRDSTQDGQEEAPVGEESTQKKDGEGRGRGRGRGRGDRGRGRGRPFDKHSATGKTDSDKKVHQGWGGDEASTELKAEEAGETDAQAEGVVAATDGWDAVQNDPWAAPPPTDDPWGATPAEGDSTPAPEAEKVDDDRKPRERELEEEDNTISYDQYLAQLKETTTASIPKLDGVRGANEGAEEVWGNVVEQKRNDDEEAYYVGKSKATTKVRAEKKEKVYIEIDAHFDRPSRGGRGRGGDRDRGRGRGGRGRRGVNGSQPTVNVNVDDETAFPSLS